jgi:hypothetical protein
LAKELVWETSHWRSALDDEECAVELRIRGKTCEDVLAACPNLGLAIRNRVADADVVLVLAFQMIGFQPWLEYEYQWAFLLRKPILGIVPGDKAQGLPPDLQSYGAIRVDWEAQSLVAGIQAALARS